MGTFRFEKDDITRYIQHKLNTLHKLREPFDYIIETMEKIGYSLTLESLDGDVDLNEVKQNKGKNYDWSVIKYKNVTLLIRHTNSTLPYLQKRPRISHVNGIKIEL